MSTGTVTPFNHFLKGLYPFLTIHDLGASFTHENTVNWHIKLKQTHFNQHFNFLPPSHFLAKYCFKVIIVKDLSEETTLL